LLNLTDQDLETVPVESLKGVGAQTATRLQRLGVRSIADLLFHLPIRYEDKTKVYPIGRLQPGHRALVQGRIDAVDILQRNRRSLYCRISDGSGVLTVRLFHFNAMQRNNLRVGEFLRCFGEVRIGYDGREMIHPEYQIVRGAEDGGMETSLTPVYRLTEGIRQSAIRRLIRQVLEGNGGNQLSLTLRDWIPLSVLEKFGLPSLGEALIMLHAPSPEVDDSFFDWSHPAQKRLALEELVAHHLSLCQNRVRIRQQKAPIFYQQNASIDAFLSALPFELTQAQQRVVSEIHKDIARDSPMMRLIHGDVGSGKTAVAACCSLAVLNAGFQVALMVPTELLAEQHYRTFSDWFSPMNIQTVCLVGNLSEARRREINAEIVTGQVGVVIGTHSLYQDAVDFHHLGLVIIDEQHRFGVHQRMALREKGRKDGLYPHQLIMTATPIPRTLAMLRFADLDISVIDELPVGRIPVVTSVIPAVRRQEVVDRIAKWIANGRQAYWVCTLIAESEQLQYEAVEETHLFLTEALGNVRIGLIHGRLRQELKDKVMMEFVEKEIDVLVATTVIEVGVDVPNAGLMIIENPERLGLAQLHQLRGRVGRGEGQSFCVLMYQTPLSRIARERLAVLRETNDGFKIAEKDLELRGSGEVMGIRQTGQIQFRIADLARDKDLLPWVVSTAECIRRESPTHIQPLIYRWVGDATQYAEV